MHIRKGDLVEVISGKDKGKRGRVLKVDPGAAKAIVEGVNMVKRHTRPNQRRGQQGGIVHREAPIQACKLMPIDPQAGRPTRVGHKFVTGSDGRRKKVRIARRSGTELDT